MHRTTIPLWILQDLNNTDKHRLIPVAVVGISLVRISDTRGDLATVQSPDIVLEHDKVFMTVTNEAGRYDDLRTKLTSAVAFQQAMQVGGVTRGMDSMLWPITHRVHEVIGKLAGLSGATLPGVS